MFYSNGNNSNAVWQTHPADNIKAEVSDLYITGLCKVWQVLLLQTDDSSTFLYTCQIVPCIYW